MQRTTWRESSSAGGVKPWAGLGAAGRNVSDGVKEMRGLLTTRRNFQLLDAIGHVWSKHYSHDEVSLKDYNPRTSIGEGEEGEQEKRLWGADPTEGVIYPHTHGPD